MKSMLWVGATLMIGASVYGFADYRQTRNKKEFQNMYATETTKVPEKKADSMGTVADQKGNVQEAVTVKKDVGTDKSGRIEPEKKKETAPVVKKKRKVRRELFSRAPLRDEEEYIETDTKKQPKTEKKEL